MRPEALSWLPTGAEGVSVKQVGVFPHRGLVINAWRIEPAAAFRVPVSRGLQFLFVTDGTGTIGGEELRVWSAVRLRPGESAALRATSRLQILGLAVRPVSELKGTQGP
jgi:hypothetical protein